MHDEQEVAERLAELLESEVGVRLDLADAAARAGSLWNVGLTSAGFVRLLTMVEEEFGLEWDLDDSVDAVATFDNLAAHVARNATRMPTAPPTPPPGSVDAVFGKAPFVEAPSGGR
jgi:acyl carrier protein